MNSLKAYLQNRKNKKLLKIIKNVAPSTSPVDSIHLKRQKALLTILGVLVKHFHHQNS